MNLIVGLGNPGDKYHNTRHNVGFLAVDRVVQLLEERGLSCIPQSSLAFKGELHKCGEWLLLKPWTFMNASGQAVQIVSNFYKCDCVIVIHDDVDLALGSVRFKFGGGAGGHNGLRSIDSSVGNAYYRVRIGIGKSATLSTTAFVLSSFEPVESAVLHESLDVGSQAIYALIQGNRWEKVASLYTRR